uniref:Sarcospan (Kras oncogene-associated gene) n=1 Tax=Callorhinchus milii TaxID=7868 RepID=A0A4W3J4W0_CALMI
MGTQDKHARSGPQVKAGELKTSEPERETRGSTEKKKKVDKKTAQIAAQDEDPHVCCGCRFPVVLALLQLAFGITITVIAFIMKSTSSSLLVRDTPYWVGIIVCVAGFLGFYMYCIIYQIDEQTLLQFIIKKRRLETRHTRKL